MPGAGGGAVQWSDHMSSVIRRRMLVIRLMGTVNLSSFGGDVRHRWRYNRCHRLPIVMEPVHDDRRMSGGNRVTVIRSVVFDVGETLLDDTMEWGRWADWIGVPRHTFSAVMGAVTFT